MLFITQDDETGIANVVVWQKVFERYRQVILSSSIIAVAGRIQREGEVVHLVAHRITGLSGELASAGERDGAFPLPHGRGDEVRHGAPTPDARGTGIRVRTRDFR